MRAREPGLCLEEMQGAERAEANVSHLEQATVQDALHFPGCSMNTGRTGESAEIEKQLN